MAYRRRKRLFKKSTMRKIYTVSLVFAAALLITLNTEYSLQLPLIPTWQDLQTMAQNYGMDNLTQESSPSSGSSQGTPSESQPLPALSGETLKVHFIDVGQGSSILIQGPGKTVLIDAGENDKGDEVLAYLKEQGISSLDMAIGTHPHSDHIGGLDTVLKAIPVKQVLFPSIPDSIVPTTKTYTDVLNVLVDKEIPLNIAEPDTQYDLGGGAVLTILGPRREYDDLNDVSIVCRVTYEDAEFLFTGDAETVTETNLLSSGVELSADVYSVPHHGSSTSSSKKYLDAVSPKVAVISVGKNNEYGHPHKEITARLEKYCPYFRTDLSGNICIATDGETINLTTDSGETFSVAA